MSNESSNQRLARTEKIRSLLKAEYPNPTIALIYSNPLELLVAVILSAQCTDVRVNSVTETLFRKYTNVEEYAAASQEDLERDVRPTGFFRNKARNIISCCKVLLEKHGGTVPSTMEELVQLPGVGRKTANCVLGAAYSLNEGVVVDTHVRRLAQRLGMTKEEDPARIEADLMAVLPREEWFVFGNRLIWHGRRVCDARKPRCADCVLRDVCPSAEEFIARNR
ncbi:MAG: endonuclease III [Bacteroidota bacterium]